MGEALKQHAFVEGAFHLVQFHHFATQPLGNDREVERIFLQTLGRGFFQILKAVEPAFALGGSGRRGGAHPFKLALHVGPGTLLNRLGVGPAFGTLFQEIAEVAVVAVQGVVFQLQDAVAHVFQEVTVVRDHQERCAHRGEPLLQPGNHVKVQVVGRLVEDQEVRRFQQHLSQRHPSFLSTAQLAHRPLEVVQVEFAQDFSRPSLEVPPFVGVHRVVGPLQVVSLMSFGERPFVSTHRLDCGAVSNVQGVQNRGTRFQLQVLAQMGVSHPRRKHHPAVVGRLLS